MGQLTTPFYVSCLSALYKSRNNYFENIDLVVKCPLAWHFFTKNSCLAILVGMIVCTITSTENNEDLLHLFFVLTRDRLIVHHAAELLRGPKDGSSFSLRKIWCQVAAFKALYCSYVIGLVIQAIDLGLWQLIGKTLFATFRLQLWQSSSGIVREFFMYSCVTHTHAVIGLECGICTQGTLESWHFSIQALPIFMLATILECRPQSGQSMHSFTGGRLTFLKLGSTSVGLVGVSGILFWKPGYSNPCFSV